MRLANQKDFDLASHALHALRSAVNSTSDGMTGLLARNQVQVLETQVAAASLAIDTLRDDVDTNAAARAIVSEYARLEKAAREKVELLSANASDMRPRRGLMSSTDKAKYVREHGQEQFLLLPY